jgi:hypothetical protein
MEGLGLGQEEGTLVYGYLPSLVESRATRPFMSVCRYLANTPARSSLNTRNRERSSSADVREKSRTCVHADTIHEADVRTTHWKETAHGQEGSK